MHKYFGIIIFLLFFYIPASAQKKGRCGTTKRMEAYEKLHPFYLQQLDRGYEEFKQKISTRAEEVLYIPVHIIIVHKPGDAIGQGTNHSFNKILSQIAVLNEDFGRTNADTINTPEVFSTGNPNVRFCLASVDPDGNSTDGITRYASSEDFNDNDVEFMIKSETRWPRETYLNLWVADIEDLGFVNALPTTTNLPNATTDGVVISHVAFGGPGTGALSPYNLGRTATHEVGHFLGLRHIWRGDGCTQDDGFEDTPIQDTENFDCPVHPSPSCNNGGDMFMNYMDYTDDNCMNAFTAQQSAFMRSILLGVRSSLITSGAEICANLALSVSIVSKKDVDCFGNSTGEIELLALGGSSPYTYTLDTIISNNGKFSNLVAGEYNITVEDNSGIETDLTITINENPVLSFQEVITDNLCYGENKGKIILSATGGTPNNVGNYFYSLNGVSYTPVNTFQSLASNTYNVHVKDTKNCIASKQIVVNSPSQIVASIDVLKNINCFGDNDGKLQINAAGGVLPFTYNLNGNENNTGLYENLGPNAYLIKVTDANNCTNTMQHNLVQPELLEILNVDITQINDSTFTLSTTVNGGSKPFTYYLDVSSTIQADSVFENVKSGEHTVWVIDKFGCSNKQTIVLSNVEELTIKDEFSISPNPVIDNLAIKYNGNKNLEVKVEIFDISGRLLLSEEKIKFSLEKNIHNIFVDNVANSILLIKIASKFKSSHILIIKE